MKKEHQVSPALDAGFGKHKEAIQTKVKELQKYQQAIELLIVAGYVTRERVEQALALLK